MLTGGVLLYFSRHPRRGRGLMVALAVLIAMSTLLFFRNFFGAIYGLLAAAAMFFSAQRLPAAVNYTIVRFIAITSCLYAVLDIRSDLFTLAPAGSGFVNDAVALSRLTGLPAIIWAILWLVVSLLVLGFLLKSSLRADI
jgi:hypothetical protein